MLTSGERQPQHRARHHKRGDPDRDVDVEHPPPRQMIDEEPTDQRAADARDREHRARVPLIAAALPRRDDVTDDRQRHRHQPPRPEALDGSEADQLAHVLRQARQCRPDQEDHDRCLEHDLAPVQIADLAVERRRRRRRQQIRRHHPRQMIQTAQITNDRRQRRRHDRLIQSRQEHPQHQPAEHHQDLPMGQLRTTRRSRNAHVRPPRSRTSSAKRIINGANSA